MAESRIIAVEDVWLDAPPGLADALRWFYGELAQLEDISDGDGAMETELCFRSERIKIRIALRDGVVNDEVAVRITILVPSLAAAKELCSERRMAYVEVSGMVRSDRRIQVLDPAGNRIELKQGWPFAPL